MVNTKDYELTGCLFWIMHQLGSPKEIPIKSAAFSSHWIDALPLKVPFTSGHFSFCVNFVRNSVSISVSTFGFESGPGLVSVQLQVGVQLWFQLVSHF